MRTFLRLATLATGAALSACGGEPSDGPRTPDRITPVAGPALSGVVGTTFPAIRFVVADGRGPLKGAQVTFAVSDDRGFVSPTTATSDTSGIVSAIWTLGGTIGQQTLTATVSGVTPATVTAQASIGPLTLLAPTSSANQFVVIGGTVASPPSVRATDAFGNPIAGQTVTFVDASGRSTVVDGTVTTAANGQAGVTSWTIGTAPGSYALTATAAPGVAANFAAYGHPALVQIAGGHDQSANTGTLVDSPPAVLALGPQNEPVAGVVITFAVTGGGGRFLGHTTAQTGADGVAHASGWVLGTTPGANTASATANGLPQLAFAATGLAAVPAELLAAAPTTQSGLAGNFGTVPPAVRLLDPDGRPVAGQAVTFTATGNGSLTGASTTTDFNGEALLPSWRFGSGPQTVTATAEGLPPVVFSATTTPPPASEYTIAVRFLGPNPPPSQRAAFENAAARWSTIILGDLEDIRMRPDDDMRGCGEEPLDEVVDDLLILARIQRIDGPGGILGRATPCWLRDNALSIVGYMEFDSDDVVTLESAGRFEDVILHEMGHVIGIGSLWAFQGLVADGTTGDPYFTGPSSRMAFAAAHTTYPGRAVPIENTGSAGTRGVHWREGILVNELMTGFLNTGANPLSAITTASLRDQGYLVTDEQADAFSLSAALRALSGPALPLHTEARPTVLRIKDRFGVTRVVDPRRGPLRF